MAKQLKTLLRSELERKFKKQCLQTHSSAEFHLAAENSCQTDQTRSQ